WLLAPVPWLLAQVGDRRRRRSGPRRLTESVEQCPGSLRHAHNGLVLPAPPLGSSTPLTPSELPGPKLPAGPPMPSARSVAPHRYPPHAEMLAPRPLPGPR